MVKSGVDFPERGDTKSESRIHGGAIQPGKRLESAFINKTGEGYHIVLPTDLLVERSLFHFLASTLPPPLIHENRLQVFQRRPSPMGHLHRMHSEVRAQLAQRLLAPDRPNRHPCLELGAVLLPCRDHRPS